MPIHDERLECVSRAEIEQLQIERLQATLNRAARNVPHYQRAFEQRGVEPRDISSLGDVARLPRVSRQTLADEQPYGMFAAPLRDVVRLHQSAGGPQGPVVIGHTRRDIEIWTEMKARSFAAAGITQNDMALVYLDAALFPGAAAAHYGAERLGACVTPLIDTPIAEQVDIMIDYRTSVLICAPSRALRLIHYLDEQGIDPKTLFLRALTLVGESSSREIRRKIAERLFVDVYENFGVSEICMPGVAFECEAHQGLHINEDHFLAEIVDPQSGEALSPGERGELTLTTLSKEAFPLVRFSTGAATSLDFSACPCGRTLARMAPVTERIDDLLIVEGVEFSPAAVGRALARIDHASSNYRITLTRAERGDFVLIEVEITPDAFNDQVGPLEALKRRIEEAIALKLRIKATARLVEPRSLKDSEQVIDNR